MNYCVSIFAFFGFAALIVEGTVVCYKCEDCGQAVGLPANLTKANLSEGVVCYKQTQFESESSSRVIEIAKGGTDRLIDQLGCRRSGNIETCICNTTFCNAEDWFATPAAVSAESRPCNTAPRWSASTAIFFLLIYFLN